MSRQVRTILGDRPADQLGRCDAHEHVWLGGPWVAARLPALRLDDEAMIVAELEDFRAAGGGWVVDTMPTNPARDPAAIARLARRSGVAIVMATGRHLARYYPTDDPLLSMRREALARLFIEEIEQGVKERMRCGVIKVAGSAGRLTEAEREVFIAAAQAQRRTGCPILTHTEADGTAMQQVRLLLEHGADAARLTLSHCDRNDDRAYHEDLLQAGVRLEYDQHFRRLMRGERYAALEWIAPLTDRYPDQLMLGMDLARRSYWSRAGGGPGLAWLMRELPRHLRRAGVSEHAMQRLYVDNPANAFAFAPVNQAA
ncbi:MAG: phosphotriesterase family protein [Phycisphaeraceae bacterium]